MRIFLAILVLTLSGCAGFQAKRDLARYGPYCDELGFQRGTTEFAQCVQAQKANALRAFGVVTQ